MAPARLLSSHDSTVLEQIFDPESAPTPSPVHIDSSLPTFPHIKVYSTLTSLRSSEILAIRAAESGDIKKAVQLLSSAIDSAPTYCSAYNNRAQVYRMTVALQNEAEMDNLFSGNADIRESVLKAYKDLTMAISLASPRTPTEPISPQTAKMLAAAHTQRATILHTTSKHFSERPSDSKLPKDLENLGGDLGAWEEAASRDFFWGGRYGNELAKAMAVHTNPYAKLCGSIVKEAMKKEIGEAF
ncbi:hypothetical protein H072_2746 [Dactylellina haptotyla CBS 200.50]|uniref:Uncharacterized protein n=1 Tax=Dactylellina haptotyla (strain CBS 200.50) TaxID=1284197 RepID=S8BUU8_DACHA|nr:hypothetical protein H072_2746 [Dactylellina haptotyla CBS 200.50]